MHTITRTILATLLTLALVLTHGSGTSAQQSGGGTGGGGTPTTPGGASTSVQFNNAGAFGGFGTWDGSLLTIGNSTISSGGTVGGQSADFATNVHAQGFQLAPGGQLFFSNGVDYGAALERPGGAVVRTTDGGSGYAEHQAQDFRLVPNGVSQPSCDATVRGTLWYTSSGAGVADAMEVCAKSSLDAYAWRSMATIP